MAAKGAKKMTSWKFTLPLENNGVEVWDTCKKLWVACFGYELPHDKRRKVEANSRCKEMEEGDYIFAYNLGGIIGGYGKVIENYDENNNVPIVDTKGREAGRHHIKVRWEKIEEIDIKGKNIWDFFRNHCRNLIHKIPDNRCKELLDYFGA